jgi:DNA-binding winged helix-turn-helix (wHTH) protein
VGGYRIDAAGPLARLADAVGAPLLEGYLLGGLPPREFAPRALAEALGLEGGSDLEELLAAAEAHCMAGHDLWVIGQGLDDTEALVRLLWALRRLRSRLADRAAVGRVMVAAEFTSYPSRAAIARFFDRWLGLPDPSPEVRVPEEVDVDDQAGDRIRYWAGTCQDLADDLTGEAARRAQDRRAASVGAEDVDSAADALLERNAALIDALFAAQRVGPTTLDLLLRYGFGDPLTASDVLPPAHLNRLVSAGILTRSAPRAWRWASRLHRRAVENARMLAHGDQFVSVFTAEGVQVDLYSKFTGPRFLADFGSRYDLVVDAVKRAVWVGGKCCRELQGNRRGFRLLDYMLRRAFASAPLVTHAQILEAVFEENHTAANIHVTVHRIRKALGEIWPSIAEAAPGEGYRLSPRVVRILYMVPTGPSERPPKAG